MDLHSVLDEEDETEEEGGLRRRPAQSRRRSSSGRCTPRRKLLEEGHLHDHPEGGWDPCLQLPWMGVPRRKVDERSCKHTTLVEIESKELLQEVEEGREAREAMVDAVPVSSVCPHTNRFS